MVKLKSAKIKSQLVAGVDSSTQSCKIQIVDTATGEIVRQGQAKHPNGSIIHPKHWIDALELAIKEADGIDDILALSVAGQQHGLILLDKDGSVIRPALLWNETLSAPAAEQLVTQKGAKYWAKTVGLVPVASFTVAKLRYLANTEPENIKKIQAVCLPHDYITWRLQGCGSKADGLKPNFSKLITDRSDASGTGYFDSVKNQYRLDILDLALKGLIDVNKIILPKIIHKNQTAGKVGSPWSKTNNILIGAGAGDNAAGAFGLHLAEDEISLSLGTSGTVCTISKKQVFDPTGITAGFADLTGNFLPLVCTLNCAKVLNTITNLLNVNFQEFDNLANRAVEGSQGLTLIPYFDGERTPNRPLAKGSLLEITNSNLLPENIARATVEGILLSQKDGVDAIRQHMTNLNQIKLIGGITKQQSISKIAPSILGCKIVLPEAAEYVALGAARQAAWVANKKSDPPVWVINYLAKFDGTLDEKLVKRYDILKNNKSLNEK
ncbi:MAG: xylulokinase [Bifidobacteriaceae bacterium]|nr:xylulokinase [Bifidobacteriaceae bacterium]